MTAPVPSVLLLDDDAADADLVTRALIGSLPAATVAWASSRQEFMDRLDAAPVDLVLSDGSVPGCEGIEAFHLARSRDPSVPFMFVSGRSRKPDLRALHALGVGDFLSKDDLAELGPAVDGVLAGKATWHDEPRLRSGLELLLSVTRELALAADRSSLITIALGAARRLTGADAASFAVPDGAECHYLDDDLADGAARSGWKGRRFPLGECLSGWTLQHRQPVVVDDLNLDPRWKPACREGAPRSGVVVPVRSARPVAALGVYWTRQRMVDTTQVSLLQALADSVAAGLEGLDRRERLAARAGGQAAELAALTYAISHDLRAPIRHLEGFARILLQDSTDLHPDARHGAQRIQDAAIHLREMVNGMLSLSRISHIEVHPQPVDLAELGREVAQALAAAPAPSAGPGRAGAVEFVVPPELITNGDPRLLRHLLQELLGNAWKFTFGTAEARVELGVAPSGVAGSSAPEYFVRDNGAGFDPVSTDRLFGAFQQLHGDEFRGIGVGLAAVKRIVVMHGGTVRATGTPGAGATFFFTLPG